MDNFYIDITAEGEKTLAAAMALAFRGHRTAIAYAIRQADAGEKWSDEDRAKHPHLEVWKRKPKPLRLVFYWSDFERREDIVKLPFKLDAAGAADFANRWLAEQDYGRQPDHDGDNGKGWRLYCEGWGHVDSIAVAPVWAMYGK